MNTNINNTLSKKENINKKVIAFFNIEKYTSNIKCVTEEVILFEERKKHIIDKHPEVKKYIHKLPEIINNPDIILQELKRKDTIWLFKIYKENVKVTLKLSNNKHFKSSVIQMQLMRTKEIKRNIRNNKVKVILDKKIKK